MSGPAQECGRRVAVHGCPIELTQWIRVQLGSKILGWCVYLRRFDHGESRLWVRVLLRDKNADGKRGARPYRFLRVGPSAVSITNAASSVQRAGDGFNSSRTSSAVVPLNGPSCRFVAWYAATARRTTGCSSIVSSMTVNLTVLHAADADSDQAGEQAR